jgi:hypothetical protein
MMDAGNHQTGTCQSMRSADTDPAAERVQIELFRNASVARRAMLARSLSRTVLELARRAIWETHPAAAPDDLTVQFVASVYGPTLAEALRRDLEARRLQRPP